MEAGAQEVEVKVLHLDDRDASLVNLLMNVARGEQDPMGASYAIYKALESGMSEEEVAQATGHSRDWVRFMKGLQKLPPVYQDALRNGQILVTHVREALRLPDLREADAALSAAITHGWNTRVMKIYVDNRLAEYEAAKLKSAKEGVSVPPPPPEPERLVKYDQCLVCGQMVPRETLHLPAVCTGCYDLAKYVTSQFGTGETGMEAIYNMYQRARAWDALQKPVTVQPPTPPPATPPKPETSAAEATTMVAEKSTPISDDKLRAIMREMLREELERRGG